MLYHSRIHEQDGLTLILVYSILLGLLNSSIFIGDDYWGRFLLNQYEWYIEDIIATWENRWDIGVVIRELKTLDLEKGSFFLLRLGTGVLWS